MTENLCRAKISRSPSPEGEEKRSILQNLQAYRAAHGRGCLEAVARAARSPKTISAMVLRDVLLGRAVLDIKDWRRIGRALDRLAEKEEGG